MGRLRQSTEKIQELLDKVESGDVGSRVTPDWNANLGEIGYIQNRPFRIIDTVSGDEYKFDTPLKESDFTLIVQENEYGDIESARWEKIIAYSSVGIMGVFANGYYEPTFGTSYKGAIRPLGQLYRQSYYYEESDYRKYIIYIENIINDHGDYYEEYSKLIVENDSGFGTDFPNADVYVLTSEDYPVRIDAIDENYLPDTIARTNDVDELREETTALWENLDHGTFPNLVAGDLAGRGESVPAEFGFRASGGKSIKDGRAYIKRIKGNSVVWNQLMNIAPFWNIQFDDKAFSKSQVGMTYIISCNDFVSTGGGQAAHTFILIQAIEFKQGHKYLIVADLKAKYVHNLKFGIYDGTDYRINGVGGGSASQCSYIYEPTSTFVSDLLRFDAEVSLEDYGKAKTLELTPRIYDLTQMFQAGNEPSTIEEFNARVATLGVDMNAYNEGQVIHMNTESIKSVGDNAWDEEWEVGGIGSNGQISTTGNRFRSKNFIRVIPNQTYTATKILTIFYYDEGENIIKYEDTIGKQFTTPTNCAYIKFYCYGTEVYDNDIMIRLDHTGWKKEVTPEYQPYWQDTLPLPIIRKYFPNGMKKAGSAHDEIRFNKATQKWEAVQRIGSVDLGTLEWYYTADFGGYYSDMLYTANTDFWGICSAYPFVGKYINVNDKEMGVIFGQCILIKDSAYTDAAALKASLQGVILYYELAEPIVTEITEDFRDYYNVADFGTEQSQSNNVPSAAFSADIIYQFNAVDMIREHELEITELQSIIATMQAQLTSLINGGQ